MPVTVIVGGQFGGEGKGKVTAHLCRVHGYDVAVRCGGPNSGHTITINDEQVVVRQIPAGVVNPKTKLFLAAGCLIDLDVLLDEISSFGLDSDRLKIDRNAAIIDQSCKQEERESKLGDNIGSTCSGTGVAVARRVLRGNNIQLAKDVPELSNYLVNVSEEVTRSHLNGEKIAIEGTQGFGLSVYHSPYYPFTTSRDTTASGFVSEVGISPLTVSDIIMVIRTFPIRVGGNSGHLPNEIDWGTVKKESGYPYEVCELTTVTKRVRRVARFDIEIVRKATLANIPTDIAIMGIDYLDFENRGSKIFADLTDKAKKFVARLECETNTKVSFIGSGPFDEEIVDNIRSIEVAR